jgi:hypothetical protein
MSKLWKAIRRPFWTRPAASKATMKSGLCSRCAQVDLNDLFHEASTPFERSQYNEVEQIFFINDNKQSQYFILHGLDLRCNLCRLFAQISPGYPLKEQQLTDSSFALQKVSITDVFDPRIVHASERPLPTNLFALSPEEGAIGAYKSDFMKRGFVAQYRTEHYDFTARRLFQTVDFDAVSGWLRDCRVDHENCEQSGTLPNSVPVFMIDCEAQKVVQGRPGIRYAALSYLWGTPASDEIQFRELDYLISLPANIPKVIEDAMVAVKCLGLNYLWVDRYCISKENKEIKHNQLRFMDQIYSHAEFTIISLAESPSEGLPGVNGTKRLEHPSATVGDYHFTTTFCYPMDVVEESKWNHRAWVGS